MTNKFPFSKLATVLLLCLAGFSPSYGQAIMFDDFTYSGVNDTQLAFNKWSIVDGRSGPPEGAMYSRNNIAFVTDPANANNKLMTVSTTVNGATKAVTNARIENGMEYFEGTYAARVYLTDLPYTYSDGNVQTFYTIVSSALAGDGSKYSELDIVEYLASDKWGVSPNNSVLYTTSYHKYQASPWKAYKTYFSSKRSWAGWHTFLASCTDGVNVKYWIDDLYLGAHSVTDNENQAGLPVYPRSPMQIAFANWIIADGGVTQIGGSTASRTATMQVDWTLHVKGQERSLAQVNALVNDYRAQGLQRRNLAGQTVVTNPCAVAAQPGAVQGSTSVAAGSSQTYAVAPVAGATSYSWTLPSGWAGSSASASITITAGSAGGTISVRANNACGSSPATTASVSVTGIPSNNLALNKPTTTSSIEGAGLTGASAVDGNSGTRWASVPNVDPQWLQVDLQGAYNITRVKINWEVALATNYDVQVSADGTNWTSLRLVTGNTLLSNDWTGLTGTGRYIRIYGTARGTQYGYSIWDLEVYGTPTSVCTVPAQPGAIQGNATVQAGSRQTYSVAPVAGATSYTWTLPLGWSGTSSSNSITATVIAPGGGTPASAGGTMVVRANNACGSSTTRTAQITVIGGSGSFSTRIEAENYTYMAGVVKENCSEGGQNVGSFDAGDWTAYAVTVPTAGTYMISYRVAAATAGKSLRLEKDAGSILLNTVAVPNTGSLQAWTTVTQSINLTAGVNSLGLTTYTGGIAINWLEIRSIPVPAAKSAVSGSTVSTSSWFYPNPATSTLNVKHPFEETTAVQILDATGKQVLKTSLEKGRKDIDVRALSPGLYIIKLSNKTLYKSEKFYKE